jgi:hypothetical protein
MKIYGCVIIKENNLIFEAHDEDITIWCDKVFAPWGVVDGVGCSWEYGGDQGFEESNICIALEDSTSKSFGGVTGLPDAIACINRLNDAGIK